MGVRGRGVFTDIVDSSAAAATLGDRVRGELVERHHATVRSLLARFRGVEVDTAGDGSSLRKCLARTLGSVTLMARVAWWPCRRSPAAANLVEDSRG